MQGFCWPKMMMGPINEQMTHFPIKFHNFNGPFEILMAPLENLTRQRILNMPHKAKLMIYLNNLYIGPKIKSILA